MDSWVGKYSGAVSWFSPGSYSKRPPLEGAGEEVLPNVKCAGDWVRMGKREHGSKGLCQERAYVSGIEAACSLLESVANNGKVISRNDRVLPIRSDEFQFTKAVELSRAIMKYIPRYWLR